MATKGLPYRVIYKSQSFCGPASPYIPRCEIEVEIPNAAYNWDIESYQFILKVSHGEYKWTLKRSTSDFEYFQSCVRKKHPKCEVSLPRKWFHAGKWRTDNKSEDFSCEQEEHLASKMGTYLKRILKIKQNLLDSTVLEFLEISALSFICDLGEKGREGFVSVERNSTESDGEQINRTNKWEKIWLAVKGSLIALLVPETREITEVILIDNEFAISYEHENSFQLWTSSGHFKVTCATEECAEEWNNYIKYHAKRFSRFFGRNSFDSFAPTRRNTKVHHFVGHRAYMDAVITCVKQAKDEVFVAFGWNFYTESEDDLLLRFSNTLLNITKNGVRVFVLVSRTISNHRPIPSSLGCLKNSSPLICILQQAELSYDSMFWSQHENLVIVDQSCAFVGVLNCDHVRSVRVRARVEQADMSIPTHRSQTLNTSESKESYEHKSQADTQRGKLIGRKEIERTSGGDEGETTGVQKVALEPEWTFRTNEVRDSVRKLFESELRKKLQPPEGSKRMDVTAQDMFNLDLRMSEWTDPKLMTASIAVEGESAVDIAFHFIQKWNFSKRQNLNPNSNAPWLCIKQYKLRDDGNVSHLGFEATCQVVRSLDRWSGGRTVCESSIYRAYIEAIKTAKNFIFIESETFITRSTSAKIGKCEPLNEIGYALFCRILRAHKEKRDFRVYVMIYQASAYKNSFEDLNARNELSALCIRSLLERLLEAKVDNPAEYIRFQICFTSTFSEINRGLLIADDNLTVIGSANIDDRSMAGNRDSELAIVVDERNAETDHAGVDFFINQSFSGTLRRNLFQLHIDLLLRRLSDLPSDKYGAAETGILMQNYSNTFWEMARKTLCTSFDVVFCLKRLLFLSKDFEFKDEIAMQQYFCSHRPLM